MTVGEDTPHSITHSQFVTKITTAEIFLTAKKKPADARRGSKLHPEEPRGTADEGNAPRLSYHSEELPAWLVPLARRVERLAALSSGSIKHALCTEYDVGDGIGWHRDKKHFDQVFGLSLASACKFRFRRKAGNKWERFRLNAQPRSLYVMTGRVEL